MSGKSIGTTPGNLQENSEMSYAQTRSVNSSEHMFFVNWVNTSMKFVFMNGNGSYAWVRPGRTDGPSPDHPGRTDGPRPPGPPGTDGRTKKALKKLHFTIFCYFLLISIIFVISCYCWLCFAMFLLCFAMLKPGEK